MVQLWAELKLQLFGVAAFAIGLAIQMSGRATPGIGLTISLAGTAALGMAIWPYSPHLAVAASCLVAFYMVYVCRDAWMPATQRTLSRAGPFLGYVGGKWTWRLRWPWESTSPVKAAIHPSAADLGDSYEQAVTFGPNVTQALAGCLIALRDLISKPVHNARDVHAQASAYRTLNSEIIQYVREKMSASQAYHLANPGMRIGVTDPDAFNAEHSSLLQEMRDFRRSLDSMYQRMEPYDHGKQLQQETGVVQSELAVVAWSQGLKDHSIANSWQIKTRVKFSQHAHSTSCYLRWGKFKYYLNASPAWEWSTQTTLLSSQTVHNGRVEEFIIAEIHPADDAMTIASDRIGGAENRETIVCLELIIAAPEKTQRARRHYALVNSKSRLLAVWLDEGRFEGARDA